MNQFYVRIKEEKNGMFLHQFFYANDLRFEKSIPCVDATAITMWCQGKAYSAIHIEFTT